MPNLGAAGEQLAKDYLVNQKNYLFLEANYRTRFGEIDLIMRHADQVVFVEVKTRQSSNTTGSAYDIHESKFHKLQKAIDHYCDKHDIEDWRAELVAITVLPNGQARIGVVEI